MLIAINNPFGENTGVEEVNFKLSEKIMLNEVKVTHI